MSTFYCGVQTRAVRAADPEPAEYCEVEVEYLDDLCSEHAEPDDDFDYGDYLQELAERRHDSAYDYYRDFGD